MRSMACLAARALVGAGLSTAAAVMGLWSGCEDRNACHGEKVAPACAGAIGESHPASGRDELVPFADHVIVLVHDRVPARDIAHALVVRAAVAHGAGLLEERSVGRLDVLLGRLAFHP